MNDMKEKYAPMLHALQGTLEMASCELRQMVHVTETWSDTGGEHVLNRWFGLGHDYYSSSPEGGTLTVKRLLGGYPRWVDIIEAMFRTDPDYTAVNVAMVRYGKARLPRRIAPSCSWKVAAERGMSGRQDLRLLAHDPEYRQFGMEGRMLSRLHLTGIGGVEGDIPFSDFPCYAAFMGDVVPCGGERQEGYRHTVELVEWRGGWEDRYAWEEGGAVARDWTSGDFATPFDGAASEEGK